MNTVGRPLEFDPDEVLNLATEAFWRNGYEATSVGDLTNSMKISKSSLYQSFGSKRQLFETCLEGYADMLSAQIESDLDKASSGIAFFENLLKSIANTANFDDGTKGCMIVNTVNEIGQKDSDISILIDRKLEEITKLFIRAIKRAQAEGDIPKDSNPRVIASYLHVAISGLRTMIKAGEDAASIKKVIQMILRAIQ